MPKVLLEPAKAIQLCGRYYGRNFWDLFEFSKKIFFSGPRGLRRTLHSFVGNFSLHTAPGQFQQNGLAEKKAFRYFEIPLHVMGIDLQPRHQFCQRCQHVVQKDARIRQYDSFHAAVADISLMPQRNVLEPGDRVASDHPCKSAQSFPGYRISLVRHSGTSFLARTEIFLQLQNLGSLQVAKFCCPAVNARCDYRQLRTECSMAITLNNLRRKTVRLQPKSSTNLFLNFGIKMGMSPDGSAEFSDRDFRSCGSHSPFGAPEFVIHQSHLQAKRDWLSVDPVASADHGNVLVFPGFERHLCPEVANIVKQDIRCKTKLHPKGGIKNI